jgi:protein phosphatase
MPPKRAVGWPPPERPPVAIRAALVAPVTPNPIDVPVPGLVVLIGAAGAGKTTLAARLFEPSELVSSDALREAVSGDPTDQQATRPAFRILHGEVRRRLAAGRLVVVDATSVEATARATLRSLAGTARVPIIAIAIVPPATEVHARNANRVGRVVPPDVVDRHLGRLDRLGVTAAAIGAALRAEGFSAAHVLTTTDEMDALQVRRVASPVSPP